MKETPNDHVNIRDITGTDVGELDSVCRAEPSRCLCVRLHDGLAIAEGCPEGVLLCLVPRSTGGERIARITRSVTGNPTIDRAL